ncbi:hypothetical protein MMC11_006304, partial [Xylographa trunciseda]|nr:hypothetical protein [Xylographa trunciseda]
HIQAIPPPHSSPDLRRDSRIAGPQPNPYASQQPPTIPQTSVQIPQHSQVQGAASASYPSPYQVSPGATHDRTRTHPQALQAAPPTSAPRPPPQSTLSRLNTGDMQIQPPPQGAQGGLQLPGPHPLQQAQSAQQQEQQSTSPSIYFHHWVPPTSSKDPQTPGGKSLHESPYSQNTTSHLRSEYTNSPKKRKTNASHHGGPGMSSKTPETSPNFTQLTSAGRRARAHSGQRSDASSRGALEALGPPGNRPESRHRQHSTSEAESGTQSQRQASVQSETQSRNSAGPEKRRTGSGTPKREPDSSAPS